MRIEDFRNGVLIALASVVAALHPGAGVTAQLRAPVAVFETMASVAAAPRTPDPGPRTQAQSRVVRPRLDVLEDAGRRGADVLVPLPGMDVVSRLTHYEAQDRGYFTAGRLTQSSQAGGSTDGDVSFTVVDGVLSGRLIVGGRLFRISRLGDADLHQIEEVDLGALPRDGQPLVAPVDLIPEQAADSIDVATAGDSNALVDLLVVYTPAARVAMGGTSAVQAEATAAVNNANLALQNSGVTHRYRTVYLAEINYTESGTSSTDLTRLRAIGDGYMDEVHGLRDFYKADVVSLLTQATDVCGIAYVMGAGSVSTSFNTLAFNVTIARSCASANLSLAHEIGHNIGLQHDRANAGSAPAFDYAYGYIVPGFARTVMAYECATGGSCPRRTIFSTPLTTFPNSTTAAGTATEDNVRAMNVTSATVANFRNTSCSFSVSPTSVTAGTAGGTGTVSVVTSTGCGWTATSSDTSIVSVTGGSSVTGSGTVSYSVSASSSPRSATLTIAGQSVSVTQSTCAPTVALSSGTPSTFGRAGGSGAIEWTFPSGCQGTSLSLASNQSWLTFTSPVNGTGNGSASFSVASNSTEATRSATISVSGSAFTTVQQTVSQTGASLTVSASSLALSAVKGGATAPLQAYSAQQAVTVTLDAAGSPAWTATTDQPWLEVVNGSGTGSGTFYVRIVNPNNVLGASVQVTANITIAAAGFTSQVKTFTLSVSGVGQSGTPFGFLDTPVAGTTVSGAIPVTGWALGSDTVTRIEVWRDAVPEDVPASIQPNGWVYIGQAAQVPGARPDVAAAFSTYPQRNSAGWGYLLLTNMLPNRAGGTGGQGAFRLHVTATQANNVMMELGDAAINVDNASATRPFGALDTPSQGGSASSMFANFGWALAKGTALIPTDSSTMAVFIDGAMVGRPTYNQCRGSNLNGGGSSFLPPGGTCDDDIATLFRSSGALNVAAGTGRAAIGSYVINTTTLTNGLHSIAWSVTDNQGRNEGIGSRNFIVANGTPAEIEAAQVEADALRPLGSVESIAEQPVAGRSVLGRHGFDLAQPWETVTANDEGARFVRVRELDRLEFDFGGPVAGGYLIVGDGLVALPAGSALDPGAGRFTWAPAAGFLGRFNLVFLTPTGRVPVSVDIVPKNLGPEHEGTRQNIDAVRVEGHALSERSVRVEGWALDPSAWTGAGIGAVHVWAWPLEGSAAPVFLGEAALGGARPDVAAAFGPQFSHAGFKLDSPVALPPGEYRVTAYIWSTRTGRWEDATSMRVIAR